MKQSPDRFATFRRRSAAAPWWLRQAVLSLLVGMLVAACASTPVPTVRRDGTPPPPVGAAAVQIRTAGTDALANGMVSGAVQANALAADDVGPQPQIRRGTGQVINRAAASAASAATML